MNPSTKKEPIADGKVVGIAFLLLAGLAYLLPSLLLIFFPTNIPNVIFIVAYFFIGLIVGLKAKYSVWGNALLLAIVALIFSQLVIVPSSRLGLESIIQYTLVMALPIIIGVFTGYSLKQK